MHCINSETKGADKSIEAHYGIRGRIAPVFHPRKIAFIQIGGVSSVGPKGQKNIFAWIVLQLMINVISRFEHEEGIALTALLIMPDAIINAGQSF